MIEDHTLVHTTPPYLLTLYEVLEFTGAITPATPSIKDRLLTVARPLLVANPENFVSRAEWRARPPRSTQALSGTEGNTLHWEGPHMGTWTHEACATKIRGIQAFHMDDRGWADIAYSSITCPHSFIFEGRWYGKRSAAQGTNEGNAKSYAHCYLGGQGDPFDMPAKQGLRRVFEHFEHRGSGTNRWGHRDWHATGCPGDAQYAWVHSGMSVDTPAPPAPPTNQKVTVTVDLPVLRLGAKGQHVQKLQAILNIMDKSNKPRLTADGQFGNATYGYIKDWQRTFKLPETGVVDKQTWETLLGLPF